MINYLYIPYIDSQFDVKPLLQYFLTAVLVLKIPNSSRFATVTSCEAADQTKDKFKEMINSFETVFAPKLIFYIKRVNDLKNICIALYHVQGLLRALHYNQSITHSYTPNVSCPRTLRQTRDGV